MAGDSGGATMASQSSILKEIYEKKGKGMQNNMGQLPKKGVPAFMKNRQNDRPDPKMDARKKVAAKRLEQLKSKGK
jgi:hypothetical protein